MQTVASPRSDRPHTAAAVSSEQVFQNVRKRDGRAVVFDAAKIQAAILKAGRATGEFGDDMAAQLTRCVLSMMQLLLERCAPEVEKIQDIVEAGACGV